MGSRQRWGVVDDMWVAALRLARGAAGESVGPQPTRVSCCFIYALPGMRECAACPRGGR
jgi:ferric iron reductase protein FhuF